MGGYTFGRLSWFDIEIYPVQERLIDGFPDAIGRLVLQDLEHVIQQGLLDKKTVTVTGEAEGKPGSRVERTVYGFYTEQPVKGARAYYMHSILHDWSDEIASRSLQAAMKPGYSRLLIGEGVIPDTGASWETTGLDIILSGLLSSRERMRAEWTRLLEEKAGLRINKIYHYLGDATLGNTSLIECELVD